MRARHVPNVTAKSVREVLKKHVKPETHLMTDTSLVAEHVGKGFSKHSAVNHSQDEYVRGIAYTNTGIRIFAIVKRKLMGTHLAVSEKHLQRYMTEAEFIWNNRIKMGIDDTQRAANAIKGAEGKRLMYRQPSGQAVWKLSSLLRRSRRLVLRLLLRIALLHVLMLLRGRGEGAADRFVASQTHCLVFLLRFHHDTLP